MGNNFKRNTLFYKGLDELFEVSCIFMNLNLVLL